MNHARVPYAIAFLLAAACTDASYTIVHVDVTPQKGISLDSYQVRVGEFLHSMPPNNTFDVVVPTPSIDQPTTVSVAGCGMEWMTRSTSAFISSQRWQPGRE